MNPPATSDAGRRTKARATSPTAPQGAGSKPPVSGTTRRRARDSSAPARLSSFLGDTLCLHTFLEYESCNRAILENANAVRRLLITSIRHAGGTVVTNVFHKFRPYGVSGVVVISESHVTVHTWPEHRYAAVDIFSCSPRLNHQVIRKLVQQGLQARRAHRRSFRRGPSNIDPPST